MKLYVRWFCESFLGKTYEDKPLFSIWLLKHENSIIFKQYNDFYINNKKEYVEQMTIFDV